MLFRVLLLLLIQLLQLQPHVGLPLLVLLALRVEAVQVEHVHHLVLLEEELVYLLKFNLLAPVQEDGQLSGEDAHDDVVVLGHLWVAIHVDLSWKRTNIQSPDSFLLLTCSLVNKDMSHCTLEIRCVLQQITNFCHAVFHLKTRSVVRN